MMRETLLLHFLNLRKLKLKNWFMFAFGTIFGILVMHLASDISKPSACTNSFSSNGKLIIFA